MSKLAAYVTISAESRQALIDFETDPSKPDIRFAMIEDYATPSDDTTIKADGNYLIGAGVVEHCKNHGLILSIIEE